VNSAAKDSGEGRPEKLKIGFVWLFTKQKSD
jgi:hypothetical protein